MSFDLHKDRTIGIWQVNLQKLIEGRISSDEEVQKRMQKNCRGITESLIKTGKDFLPMRTK